MNAPHFHSFHSFPNSKAGIYVLFFIHKSTQIKITMGDLSYTLTSQLQYHLLWNDSLSLEKSPAQIHITTA